ncbi:MAG: VOC family protein [Phenylobacterium sp.]|uniref:VOC family protein n=1 Tax=Phenylobacterium sp. TaxID=1871053 RepID=UPI002732350A|nr:VOC family protein [Phenylobacterium sp.]MDP3748109.1 VOC family protein [Phenylobacterium sp.]
MLGNNDAAASLAVKDMSRARRFYEDVLGLQPVDEEGGEVVTYKSGASTINVYRSEFAGTNKATALTWQVTDIDAAVADLKRKGVAFEHYQMPEMKQEGDVYAAPDGHMKVAWFKDPDGNILNLIAEPGAQKH